MSVANPFSSAIPIALQSSQAQMGVLGQAPTYYAFTVTDPGRLIAEVTPTGGAARLTLLSSAGQILVQSDGQSPGNHDGLIDLHLTGSTAGATYYLEVQGLGTSTGSYTLVADYTATNVPGQPLPAGIAPWNIATADFNGDGKVDLAVANYYSGTVTVFQGTGDGTFEPGHQLAAEPGADCVVAGDFTGNGHLDLAIANFLTGTISILAGNGDGTFQSEREFSSGGLNPVGLTAGDFTGNGKLDLAVTNYGSGTVDVLMNHAGGAFAAPTAYLVGSQPYGIVAGDFTGDGKLDLAVANHGSNNVSIFLGKGDGTFAPQARLASGSAPSTIVAADFNNDGRLELVTGNYNDGTISLFLGVGDGTFAAQQVVAVGGVLSSVAAADFRHDGAVDLAFSDLTANVVHVLVGNGDGTFQTPPPRSPPTEGYGLAVADLTGNGNLDLIATNTLTGTIAVLLGHGDGTFGSPSFFLTGQDPVGLVVGDFNGDGHIDVATADSGSGQVSVLFGDGTGRFAPPVNYAVGLEPEGLTAADFNRDGRLDLAVTSLGSNTVSVFLNNGNGTFAPPIQLNTGSNPYGVTAADFNGDGNLDLAVADSGSASVSVFPGDGRGNFGSALTVPMGPGLGQVLVGNFNGDGKLDLASVDTYSNQVSVVMGNGDGTFGPATQTPVGLVPLAGLVGDFNGDGNPDIVTVNSQSSDISLLRGQGDGTFRAIMQTAIATGPVAVANADFNNDGHPDLVTANPTTGNVDVSLGNGDGTFQTPITVAHMGEPVAVTTIDFNLDGRPDIIVADCLTNTVSVLLGVGDGTFETSLPISVGNHPIALVAGSFDGDNDPEVAVANYGSGTVTILEGHQDGTFTVVQQIAVGEGPVALALATDKSDGITDLVVANSLSRSVIILEGAGDGTFQLTKTMPLGFAPGATVTGDFNGAGNQDIAVADQAGNAVSVLLGNADGTFQAAARFATGTGPISLVLGDFNGDGHLDLATANNNSNDATVLLGRGDGTFQSQKPFGVGAYPAALVAVDFNNDGRLDLATANGQGVAVSVGLGFGNGTFTAPGAAFAPVQSRPIVADFNGDGILDVVVLRGDGKILFRPGQPGGGFGAPVVINPDAAWDARDLTVGSSPQLTYLVASNARIGSFSLYAYLGGQFRQILTLTVPGILPAHILYGDINGDGLLDAVMYLGDTGQIIVYLQHPNDDLSDRPPDHQIHVGDGVSAIAIADVNGDGRPDIIVTDQTSGEVHVFLNSAIDAFSSELSFRTGDGLASVSETDASPQVKSRETPVAMVVGLFNGDAIPDIAVLNKGTNRVDILVGDGRGGMFNPSPATSLLTGLDPVAIVTADFNGDGIADLAVLNKGSNDISIFLGNGHGGFTEKAATGLNGQKIRLSAGNSPTGLTAADFNGDGKLELLVGDAQGDVLTMLGNGDGTFRPYQRIDRHVGLAVSDGNADGQPEFAFANQSLDSVTYQSDQSGATFQVGRQDGVLNPNAVHFADLNGDAIPDLIVANGGGNDVLVYLGLGSNQFGPAHRFFVGTSPEGITVSDLNGDGIPDLVVANEGSNDLSVLFGQGQGAGWTMTPGPRLDTGTGPAATVVQDVNGDGIPDILVANGASNNVYMIPGVGRGFFDDQNPVIYQTGSDPVQLFVGQFDNQPGLDLVTVNAGSSDLTFFSSFGPGKSMGTGAADPVAAVAGDFRHNGTNDLIVAHQDGQFTLLQADVNGPQVTSVLTLAGVVNISDLALGQMDGTSVEVYATTEGLGVAIPVTFLLDLASTLPDSGASAGTVAAASGTNVATFTVEFSSPSGSHLELIATIVVSFNHDSPIEGHSSVVPAAWVGAGESAGADHEVTIAALDEAAGSTDCNTLISGADATPVQQYLRGAGEAGTPAVGVPFPSPLGSLDVSGESLVSPRVPDVVDDVGGRTPGAANPAVPPNQSSPQPSAGVGDQSPEPIESFTETAWDETAQALADDGNPSMLGREAAVVAPASQDASRVYVRALTLCVASMYLTRDAIAQTKNAKPVMPRRA